VSGYGGLTYAVKDGDTLVTIAARELGDFMLWHELAEMNDKRDPARLTVGEILRLPLAHPDELGSLE
jgi:nucleoid-associated protein YgaU